MQSGEFRAEMEAFDTEAVAKIKAMGLFATICSSGSMWSMAMVIVSVGRIGVADKVLLHG
jgi:hypothetical protein